MEQVHHVKIKVITKITHDVLKIVTEKPLHFTFTPGQATDVSLNKNGWRNQKRPFSFTSLPENDYLEFTIKVYPSHLGVTNQLPTLQKDQELILHDAFGAIAYKGEGVFIAGGAGVTPFISILRYLQSKNELGANKLIFANKSRADIILVKEFGKMLDKNFINILSEEKTAEYVHGQITEEFLRPHLSGHNKPVYVCGPPPMMEAIEKQLDRLGVDSKLIVREVF